MDKVQTTIYTTLNTKETETLLKIWETNDRFEYTNLAFEIIHDILIERGVNPPVQNQAIYEQPTVKKPLFPKLIFDYQKYAGMEDQPVFYSPHKVRKFEVWLKKFTLIFIIGIILQEIVFSVQYFLQYFPTINKNSPMDISLFIFENLGAILGAIIYPLCVFVLIKVLSMVMMIIMEMEFTSRINQNEQLPLVEEELKQETSDHLKKWHVKFENISKILNILAWIVFIFMVLGIIPEIINQIQFINAAVQESYFTLGKQIQLIFQSLFSVLTPMINGLILWTILHSISLGLKTLAETDQTYRNQENGFQPLQESHQTVFYDPHQGYQFLSNIKKYKWLILIITALSEIAMIGLLSRAVFLPMIGVNNQNIFYLFMIGILGIFSLIFTIPIFLISLRWVQNILHGLIETEQNSCKADH